MFLETNRSTFKIKYNLAWFEIEKIDKWGEDRRSSLKLTLKDLDEQVKELKKQEFTIKKIKRLFKVNENSKNKFVQS